MDPQKQTERLLGQIDTQKQLIKQYTKEGNELGVRRAEKKIKEYEKEIKRLT